MILANHLFWPQEYVLLSIFACNFTIIMFYLFFHFSMLWDHLALYWPWFSALSYTILALFYDTVAFVFFILAP